MKGRWKQRLIVGALSGSALLIVQAPQINTYVTAMKQEAMTATAKHDLLMQEIKDKAKKYEVAPKNAMIDSVWKTVPGYNGLKVDVKASYDVMKKKGVFDEKKLIFKQIPPNVHMSQLKAEPIYRAHPDKPVISLLINVAWGNEYLPGMLTTLKKHQVKATFFLEGRWTKNNPELAKMIAEAGHEIGNHSYTHPNMETLSSNLSQKELEETNKVIKAVTGKDCTLFAPPSGAFRQETVAIADKLGMDTILWSVDTIDWQKPSPSILTQRVLSKLHNGAFILMHPTEPTAKSLDILITSIKKRQLEITTVSDALEEERIIR
ncbi:polysaccharide deacetylase family protein [Bacillus testis]|uniref:polysaccharide deacetylase family protein n=1 Tax=Bacillus testis TaxID=1622072 RepID=UPI00067EDD72|nr:polysaccharide deacetylase family protein [Bacillus testis]